MLIDPSEGLREVAVLPLLLDAVDWNLLGEKVRVQQRNREIHTPLVSLYRWWARRSHALIGALLDAAEVEAGNPALLISDPLSGGGTVAIEAALRGYRIYAQDIHPWAAWGLATVLDGAEQDELKQASEQLLASAARFRTDAYSAECPEHGPSETVHAFWVKECRCDGCDRPFFLFPYTLVTVASRSKNESEGFFGCPACGHVSRQSLSEDNRQCISCQYPLPGADSPLLAGRRVRCPHCSFDMPVANSIKVGWRLVLVQRACKALNDSMILHFDLPRAADYAQAQNFRLPIPSSLEERIPDGLETMVLHRMGFHRWADLYPPRQLHCLLEVSRMTLSLPVSGRIHDRLLHAILGAAEMAGYLCRWDRYHPKAFEAMANHRFSPVGLGVEVNLLSPRGRGTIPHRLAASVRAARWSKEKFHNGATAAMLAKSNRRRWSKVPSHPVVVAGSSERQLLPARSVDLVLTDPPYFDSVQYGELCSVFYVWARATQARAGELPLDLSREAVPNATRGTDLVKYRLLLERIFAESARTLKQSGRMILTFHSTNIGAWHALASALRKARLEIMGLAVCNSENETDHAKRGKRAFTKDLIIECRFRRNGRCQLPVVTMPVKDDEDLELVSAGFAVAVCGDKELDEFKSDFLRRIGPSRRRRIN